MVAGDPKLAYLNTPYQGYILDPITFEIQAPSTWLAHHYEFGPSSQNIRIDWRSGSFVSQRFDELKNELSQNVWDVLTGENYLTFSFTHYVDNGWFYDPLRMFIPTSFFFEFLLVTFFSHNCPAQRKYCKRGIFSTFFL